MNRSGWACERIAVPWGPGTATADPEQLFRKEFALRSHPVKARLYITAQGGYEVEVDGSRVSDYFLALG